MKPGPVHVDLQELGVFQLASPCSAKWSEMDGDHRSRLCGSCQKHVYNLEQLTFDEIRALMREKEGRACMRFFRRKDGTVLTRDCPEGVRALKSFWRNRPPQLVPALWLGFAAGLCALTLYAVVSAAQDNLSRLNAMSGALAGSDAPPPNAGPPSDRLVMIPSKGEY